MQLNSIDEAGDFVVAREVNDNDLMVQILKHLADDCHRAKADIYAQCETNESLRMLPMLVEFDNIECVKAERWIDHHGDIGWRVHVNTGNRKLLAAMLSKLRDMGWDDIEIVEAQ